MGLNGQDYTQQVNSNVGLRTQYGVILPPGARVAAYVRSTGIQSGDDTFLAQNLVATLAAGLARCRPNMGDFVVCLPGHVENVADGATFSTALVAGSRIVGVGRGTAMPTFTWTATASQWNVIVADVYVGGLKLLFDGITAVVNAINVTGTDFGFCGNEIQVSSAAKAPTAAITIAATASRADISGNYFRGLASSVATNLILVNGSNNDSRICDNEFNCAVSGAIGHIAAIGGALGLRILRNQMYNTAAGSTACIAFGGGGGADGIVAYNNLAVLGNGVASAQGILFPTGGTIKCFQNFCSDESQRSGVLSPVAVAT